MRTTIHLTISLLLCFITGIPAINAQHDAQTSGCALPPPQQISIVSVTSTSLSILWSPVPGAALYKVSLFDQTDQVAFPDTYTSSNSINLGELDTETHEYLIGVSASSCVSGGDFGAETTIEYKAGFIIIIDELVQVSETTENSSYVLNNGDDILIELPFNSIKSDKIFAKKVNVHHTGNNGIDTVEFYIWSDCYQDVRFCQTGAVGTKRLSNGNKILYFLKYSNTPFFDIIKEDCGPNSCNVTLSFHLSCGAKVGSCSIEKDEDTCGNGSGGFLRQQDENDHSPASLSATATPEDSKYRQSASVQSEAGLRIAPNPFSDAIHIEYNMDEPALVTMSLYNATGAIVQQLMPMQWIEKGDQAVDFQFLQTLPNGTYFLVTNTGQHRCITPLMKQ